jgi:hypothetical protein
MAKKMEKQARKTIKINLFGNEACTKIANIKVPEAINMKC